MDCCYLNGNGSPTIEKELPNVSSPEMFDSDNEDNKNNETLVDTEEAKVLSPPKISQSELAAKSDNNLLARINKLLTGVPPPPKHTICRTDCAELLLRIYENRHLFWTPCPLPGEQLPENAKPASPEEQNESTNRNNFYRRTRSMSRNLTDAFDACDLQYQNSFSKNSDTKDLQGHLDSDNSRIELSVPKANILNISENVMNISSSSSQQAEVSLNENQSKQVSPNLTQHQSLIYHTVSEKDVATLAWPEAYHHKFHGIHYNSNRAIEEFENLTTKLCERYIGVETQSTCTVWFSKPAPGSARKRSLLAKQNNGQSPGKRLNHLTRRRRTFSSANLQGLALNNKKLLVLNIRKPFVKKGKSPRGKSPRCKSPRGKSPRSSTKKKIVRRLVLDGTSPLKSKLETSKRALFQSPPSDRAGPSKLFTNGSNCQNIKRVLFPSSKKKEDDSDGYKVTNNEESRKRKSEEELEGPRYKWPKSLSFDCSRELHTTTISSWDQERHSSSNVIEKNKASIAQGRNELNDRHRKKLFWAVAEALRTKGIGMTHPQFKHYAANLARTIKKFMPDLEDRNIPRKPGSTSDRMLKLAKHHVLFVVDARPTD